MRATRFLVVVMMRSICQMFTLLSPQTVRHLHGATEVIVTTFFNNFIASGSSGMLIPSLPIYIILRDRSRDMLSRHVVERLV